MSNAPDAAKAIRKAARGVGAALVKAANDDRYWELRVTVLRAWNLRAMDSNGLSDPYVRVTVGEETYQTSTIKKSLDVTFNETFRFRVAHETCLVRVVVFDEDFLGQDDYLGGASSPISFATLRRMGRDVELELHDERDPSAVCGRISVRFDRRRKQPPAAQLSSPSPSPATVSFDPSRDLLDAVHRDVPTLTSSVVREDAAAAAADRLLAEIVAPKVVEVPPTAAASDALSAIREEDEESSLIAEEDTPLTPSATSPRATSPGVASPPQVASPAGLASPSRTSPCPPKMEPDEEAVVLGFAGKAKGLLARAASAVKEVVGVRREKVVEDTPPSADDVTNFKGILVVQVVSADGLSKSLLSRFSEYFVSLAVENAAEAVGPSVAASSCVAAFHQSFEIPVRFKPDECRAEIAVRLFQKAKIGSHRLLGESVVKLRKEWATTPWAGCVALGDAGLKLNLEVFLAQSLDASVTREALQGRDGGDDAGALAGAADAAGELP